MWRTNMGASLEILLKNHFPPVSMVSASLFAAWHECVNHSSRMARICFSNDLAIQCGLPGRVGRGEVLRASDPSTCWPGWAFQNSGGLTFDRKRREARKFEGRKSHAELRPNVVALGPSIASQEAEGR
jgi:hypothetical protein